MRALFPSVEQTFKAKISHGYSKYLFTQPFRYEQEVTWGQFFSGVKLVWIQRVPSSRWKSPVYT